MSVIVTNHYPSALTDVEALKLGQLANRKTVLELGAQYGKSTVAMASTARLVHSVDWHQGDAQAGHGDSLTGFLDNVRNSNVESNIIIHVGRFEDILPVFRQETFEFCFIDGCHERPSLERDINLVLPLVTNDALIAFHDYGRFDVTPVINEVFGQPFELIGTVAVVRLDKWS